MNEGMQMIHDALDFISRPRGVKMTEYAFEINRKVKVALRGADTEENREKAVNEAIAKAKKEIDEGWLEYADAEEFVDYEN